MIKYIKKSNSYFTKIVAVLLIGIFLVPANALASHTWTERQPAGGGIKSWEAVASDADGSFLIAGVYGGRLYTSSDSGENWTERQPAGDMNLNWVAVASDADGSHLIAGTAGGGLIYYSTDSGATWSLASISTSFANVGIVAVDADGSNMLAAFQNGRFYTSSDSGANWIERQPAGDITKTWFAGSFDADGSFLIAGAYGGRLYTSSDSGANWTERQPAGDVNRNWFSGYADNTGTNLVVSGDGVNGRIYTSSDSGANWTERQPAGDISKNWYGLDMDDDGSVIVAAAYAGRVYLSEDGGATWNEEQTAGDVNKNWYRASLDSDGSNIIVSGDQMEIYTGVPPDATAPTVSTLSPADEATGIALAANLVITFDEAVDVETGDIVIYKASDDSVFETIDVTSGNVTGTGTDTITINPTGTLTEQTAYYVQIDATAFDDAASNSYAGIADETTWNFTTGDFTNPTVSTLSPLDEATGVTLTSNLVITFDEAVDVETGNITIKKVSDDSTVETIAVGSANVTGTGTTTITIDPTNELNYQTEYYIQIDATAFDDVNSNSYAGIADGTTWNFTTVNAPVSSSGSRKISSGFKVVCNLGDKFSTTTGLLCTSFTTLAPVIPTPSCPIIATLKFGSRSEEVKCLQSILEANPKLTFDGMFGSLTKAAVVNFQKLHNLVPDGIVGPKTRGALNGNI
ncbi:MAG: Ig-like domain-containing protein [bacterium]|nr:Ig-like domain-containing protein [bacterium]